ncbi:MULTISPECIES: class I SAM-dependent methyltransferase [unclassified Methylophilus]|uniref:class I SAM-dependent methyltransferase n=1 Tax=unclassified Methylophilus TaxID=2630143 RepID=UPI0003829821|nr:MULTISPECIES: class I SAM-dependent methyltransferase [unclassified Methylophilus]
MKCRHCHHETTHPFLDLGSSPPSNAYLTTETLNKPEKWFPLKVMVCDHCWLVQTEDFADAHELFDADYAYFSSFSSSWLAHAQHYVESMVGRFKLDSNSRVIEIAANDGYLLQYVQAQNIPCLGIEPTHSTAEAARGKGIEIIEEFFGVALAEKLVAQGYQADLTAANNVLAHVPDINDFVGGFSRLLKPNGVSTFEFPHLVNLVQQNQFDTIYHEHFSYLSLTSVKTIFEKNGLQVFDVEEIPTHGGSLRVYAQRSDTGTHPSTARLQDVLNKEQTLGIDNLDFYQHFQEKVNRIKNDLISFLIEAQKTGKKVIAYGAAAKGNTLLNFTGVRPDLLPYVVDKNPAKQNKFMPGSRIPIVSEEIIRSERPDYILILPWNIKQEVVAQLDYVRDWSAKFVTAIPMLTTQ